MKRFELGFHRFQVSFERGLPFKGFSKCAFRHLEIRYTKGVSHLGRNASSNIWDREACGIERSLVSVSSPHPVPVVLVPVTSQRQEQLLLSLPRVYEVFLTKYPQQHLRHAWLLLRGWIAPASAGST